MAVSIKYTDNQVSAVVTIPVTKADYQGEVEKVLKNYRQRADIPGFRRGHAPMGMIQKKFGLGAKIEEINRYVGRKLYEYINENKLNVLGEPLPALDAPEQDLEKGEDFEFSFDIALAPKVDVQLTKDDKIAYYKIEATDEMVSQHIEQMLNSHGTQVEVDTVEERDLVKGLLVELEGDTAKDGGVRVENAMLLPSYVKNADQKAKFVGAAKNSVVVFEPYAAYEGNVHELASFLAIDKEQVEAYKGVTFSFEITSISRHVPAELNEEFFKSAFGEEGEIKDEQALREKVREGFREQFDPESDYKFLLDLRKVVEEKAGDVKLADDLLKRWLKVSNDKLTEERIEAEYPQMTSSLVYQLVKDAILAEHKVEVTDADILAFAVIVAKSQFAQYGMTSVPDEMLHNYAKSLVEKEDTRRNIASRVLDNKFAEIAKSLVTLENKTVSPEEFGKLMNPEA